MIYDMACIILNSLSMVNLIFTIQLFPGSPPIFSFHAAANFSNENAAFAGLVEGSTVTGIFVFGKIYFRLFTVREYPVDIRLR